jgi:hypothetical protein
MATWQADFHVLVPGALPADYRERLASLLPTCRSWREGLEVWGTDDGDRIDISHEPHETPEVFVRFDLRRWNPELYRRFVAFVGDVAGELRTADGTLVPLRAEELENTLRCSDAARFVANPREFLEGLSRENPPT